MKILILIPMPYILPKKPNKSASSPNTLTPNPLLYPTPQLPNSTLL
jgi:hypothetical protein